MVHIKGNNRREQFAPSTNRDLRLNVMGDSPIITGIVFYKTLLFF